jgi:hypothetical protein
MNTQTEAIAVHNAFKRGYFEHGHGIFSVQSGEEHHRGTGYMVLTGDIALIHTDDGHSHSYEALQDFVGQHRHLFSEATAEPHFLTIGGSGQHMVAAIGTVENLYDAAVRLARKRDQHFIWDFARDTKVDVEQPSLAAIEFLLDTNPWDRDYIRSHI